MVEIKEIQLYFCKNINIYSYFTFLNSIPYERQSTRYILNNKEKEMKRLFMIALICCSLLVTACGEDEKGVRTAELFTQMETMIIEIDNIMNTNSIDAAREFVIKYSQVKKENTEKIERGANYILTSDELYEVREILSQIISSKAKPEINKDSTEFKFTDIPISNKRQKDIKFYYNEGIFKLK